MECCDQAVCGSVREHFSRNISMNFKFSAHRTYGHGSILLSRRCNMLYSLRSVLWMTPCLQLDFIDKPERRLYNMSQRRQRRIEPQT